MILFIKDCTLWPCSTSDGRRWNYTVTCSAVNDDYNSVVLVEYDSSISSMRVLEDDYVDMYGTSAGLFTYSSTMGGDITIPALLVNIIEIRQ